MPNSPRRPFQEFREKRIPGARFLDLDEVASPHGLGLKHMMPSERVFADACGLFSYRPPFLNVEQFRDRKTGHPPQLPCRNVSSPCLAAERI